MKYRMHKRVETKPDGRTIYYYTFEPAQAEPRPHQTGESSAQAPTDVGYTDKRE